MEGGGASAGLLPLVLEVVVQLLRGVPTVLRLALVPVLGRDLGVPRAASDRCPEMNIVIVCVGGGRRSLALLMKLPLGVLVGVSVGLVELDLSLVLRAPLQSVDLTVVGPQIDHGVISDSFGVNFSDGHCCDCWKITCGL